MCQSKPCHLLHKVLWSLSQLALPVWGRICNSSGMFLYKMHHCTYRCQHMAMPLCVKGEIQTVVDSSATVGSNLTRR